MSDLHSTQFSADVSARMAAEGFVPLTLVNNPISGDIMRMQFPLRLSLAEMVASVPNLPDRFHSSGIITVHQGRKFSKVPRKFWAKGEHSVNLWLNGNDDEPVFIRLHGQAAGGAGGGNGVKNVLSIVATLALVAAGTFITGGGLAVLLGAGFAANTFGAAAAAFAVTFLGRLALSTLLQPAATSDQSNQAPQLGQAGASGNLVSPGGALYYCAGYSKVFPHLVSLPLVELVGKDELVEAAFSLAGPHSITNPKAEGTAFNEIDGLSYLINEANGNANQHMLQRYGVQSTPQYELQAHNRDKVIPYLLAHQANPELDLPKAHIETSKQDPDEIWLQYLWPAGLTDTATNAAVFMPIRLKMAIAGTNNWINLPEFMFHSNLTGRISKKIVLSWATPPANIIDQAFTNGAWYSFWKVPAQNVAPVGVGDQWNAHASFNSGLSIYNTLRVERREDGFIVYLDPAVFPRGNRWKVWMMRGSFSPVANYGNTGKTFLAQGYFTSTTPLLTFNLFDMRSDTGVRTTANGTFFPQTIVDSCILMRFASVWNKKPVPLEGDANIQIKGKNLNITQVSVEASAIVKCWDGAGFNNLGPSNNPADHVFNTITGPLANNPVPEKYVNVPQLGAWWAENVAASRTISAVLDGREWRETINAMAAPGLAKLYEGRLWGVTRQRDTKSLNVAARQVFTHLNMDKFRFSKNFTDVPDAMLVSYRNKNLDWDDDELLVLRPGVTAAEANRIIKTSAVGIDNPAQVKTTFELYLAAAYARDHSFSFETWFDGLACEKGDIIQINHLQISENMSSGRIVEIERNGFNEIVAITLDTAIDPNADAGLETVLDLSALENIFAQGLKIGCIIATGAGLTSQPVTAISNVSKRLQFEVPFINDQVEVEHMVMLGKRGEETLRLEVTDVEHNQDLNFTLSCVPEAPEMWIR
jgi:hypothetical protein